MGVADAIGSLHCALGQSTFGQRIPAKDNSGTPTSRANAAEWNKPGGYDQWVKGDAQREKDMPIGTILPRKKPEDEE